MEHNNTSYLANEANTFTSLFEHNNDVLFPLESSRINIFHDQEKMLPSPSTFPSDAHTILDISINNHQNQNYHDLRELLKSWNQEYLVEHLAGKFAIFYFIFILYTFN